MEKNKIWLGAVVLICCLSTGCELPSTTIKRQKEQIERQGKEIERLITAHATSEHQRSVVEDENKKLQKEIGYVRSLNKDLFREKQEAEQRQKDERQKLVNLDEVREKTKPAHKIWEEWANLRNEPSSAETAVTQEKSE